MSVEDARERLTDAQRELDAAVAEGRRLAELAEPFRRRRALVLTLGSVLVVAAAVVAASIVGSAASSESDRRAATTSAVASARTAVTTVLTVDPTSPSAYVDAVRGVSSGDFRRRVDAAGSAIASAVAGLAGPSAGRVIAAGAESALEKTGSDTQSVTVYVVADGAGGPLLAGDSGTQRLRLSVRMAHRDGDDDQRWTIASVRR